MIYDNNPQTFQELKTNTACLIFEIKSLLCKNVIENVIKKINIYIHSRGGHLSDTIFHL